MNRADQIFQAFRKFHRANPQVWELFKRFTEEAIRSGRKNYSSYAIFERIRWHTDIETTGKECKINNNFRPYYGRLYELAYPEYKGFFHKRFRTSQRRPASGTDQQFFNYGPSGDETVLNEQLFELLTEQYREILKEQV